MHVWFKFWYILRFIENVNLGGKFSVSLFELRIVLTPIDTLNGSRNKWISLSIDVALSRCAVVVV